MVCGARALNFLCAANDVIYESPYSAKLPRRARSASCAMGCSSQLQAAKRAKRLAVAYRSRKAPWTGPAVLGFARPFRAGAASPLSGTERIGAASRHRGGAEPGSLGVAKRINRSGRDLSALLSARGTHAVQDTWEP